MNTSTINLIKGVDVSISKLCVQWLNAKPEDKPAHMEAINSLLDHRLQLTQIRDTHNDQTNLQ